MSDSDKYWGSVCSLVHELRCWVRACTCEGGECWETPWSSLLVMPVQGYLEVWGEPEPLRRIKWVELSSAIVKKGKGVKPYETVDIFEAISSRMGKLDVEWEVIEGAWSFNGSFDEEPVRLVRIHNPFFEGGGDDSR